MGTHSVLRKREGISGIIAALILFVMLFTVGTGYFLWVSNNNSVLSQAQAGRVQAVQEQQLEDLVVTPGYYCSSPPCNGDGQLTFTVQNTGDAVVALEADFVDTGGSTCTVPIDPPDLSLNPGSSTSTIQTGCAFSGSMAVIKVLTQRGNVFSASYVGSEISTSLSSNPVMAGQSVFDTATLTDVSPTAGGEVTYSYYAGGLCSGTGVVVSRVTVNDGAVPNSVAQVFNTAGSYSWNAVYSGDANNPPATSTCEPLSVQDSITTQLSSTKVVVGGSVFDSAALSGVTTNAGGTVTYYAYTNGICSAGQTLVSTVTVTSGIVPSSGYFGPYTSSGTYSWDAVYQGDGVNQAATSPCEPLTVSPGIITSLSDSTIYLLGSVYDTATLGGATGSASGTVTYYYSAINACPSVGAIQVGNPVTVTDGNVPNSALRQFTSPGNYYWYAVYSGDANNNPSTSPCEPLTVLPEGGGGGTGSLQQVVGSFKFYFAAETGSTVGCSQSNPSGSVPNCLGDGVSVGGYYGYGLSMSTAGSSCPSGNFFFFQSNPSCVDVVFQITLTNTDPTRSITLGPQSLLWLQGTCQTAASNGNGGYFFARGQCSSTNFFNEGLSQGYWIVNGPPTSAGQGAIPLPYANPVTIAPGAVATLYFYCAGPCTSQLLAPTYNPPPGTYVEASLDLYGLYSDNTPFGQNIPFIATYISPAQITGCAIGTSYSGTNTCWPTTTPEITAAAASSVTLAIDGLPCTSVTMTNDEYGFPTYSCTSGDSFPVLVNWVSPTGGVTQVGENPTCSYASEAPGGNPGYCTVTFEVPSTATSGSVYAIYVTSDGVNNAYATVGITGASSTVVTCSPTLLMVGGKVTCQASVTGVSPTGTVTFVPSGSNILTPSSQTCTLSGGTCSVTFTGNSAGTSTVTGTYSGDVNNQGSSGTSSPIQVVSLSITPSSGPVGTTTTLSGSGYSVSTPYGYCLSTASATVTCVSGTASTFTSSATGTIPSGTTIVIPSGTVAGTYYVTVYQGSSVIAYATFTVTTPTLAVSPTSGPPGTSTTLTGTNYAAGVQYSDCLSTSSTSVVCITGSTSSFTATGAGNILGGTTVKVPAGTAAGSYFVIVYQSSSVVSSASFTVTASSISLNVYTGAVGTAVTVTGTNFLPTTTITIKFNGVTQTTTPGTVTTNSAGSFTATFVVPAAVAGAQTVTASDGTNTVPATFMITPAITLSPTSGPVGTTVTVTGTGFAASSAITIKFNGATVTTSPTSITTSGVGGFTATFVVPSVSNGPYTVTATDASANTASTTFTVIAKHVVMVRDTPGTSSTSSPFTCSFSTQPTVGDLIVVSFTITPSTLTVSSVKDSASNSLTPVTSATETSSAVTMKAFTYEEIVPSGDTSSSPITVTLSGNPTSAIVTCIEFSGVLSGTAVQSSTYQGTSTSSPMNIALNSPGITPTANDLVYAYTGYSNCGGTSSPTTSSPYTAGAATITSGSPSPGSITCANGGNDYRFNDGDQYDSSWSSGSTTAPFTVSQTAPTSGHGSSGWVEIVVEFDPPSQGAASSGYSLTPIPRDAYPIAMTTLAPLAVCALVLSLLKGLPLKQRGKHHRDEDPMIMEVTTSGI